MSVQHFEVGNKKLEQKYLQIFECFFFLALFKFICAGNKGIKAKIGQMASTEEFPTEGVEALVEGFKAATQIVNIIPDSESQSDNTQPDNTQSTSSQSIFTHSDNTEPHHTPPLMSSPPIPRKRSRKQGSSERGKRARSENNKENSFSVEAKCKGEF